VRIAEAVEDASVRIVDPAILSSAPVGPRKRLNVLLGLLLGAMLGVGVAFLREYMDDSVHTREDLLQVTGGLPVMGLIPRIHVEHSRNGSAVHRNGAAVKQRGGTLRIGDHLVAGLDPRSWTSEAYRGLRTNIMFANPDEPPNTLVITSPLPRDGKSTTATNLAVTLAQLGRRALLVDADMRRGCLHDVFDLPQDPGLSEILAGENVADEAIHTIDLPEESGTLFFLSSGALPPNPAELLGSARMKGLLKSLKAQFDAVILDCPPLLAVTDAAILGTHADGTLLVVRANVTEKGAITHCVEQLRQVRAPVLGIILNDVDPKRDGRYGEPYGMYDAYSKDHRGNGNGARRASDKRWGASPRPEPPRPHGPRPQPPRPRQPLHPAVKIW
jgi:capsular exopolysaccharide synthesis family protein